MLNKDQYFTGTIVEIIDSVLYQIKVDIPGIAVGVSAFPMRGEIDEPRVGDFVLLRSLDSVFNSYFLYQKIKENSFIGFRSNGKMVDITPDYITIAIYDPKTEYNDLSKDKSFKPIPTDWIKLDKSGNLEISLRSNSNITISGSTTISVEGDSNITVNGSTKLNSSEVTISGGKLIVNGTVSPSGTGPFCGLPACAFTGAPHTGNIVNGT